MLDLINTITLKCRRARVHTVVRRGRIAIRWRRENQRRAELRVVQNARRGRRVLIETLCHLNFISTDALVRLRFSPRHSDQASWWLDFKHLALVGTLVHEWVTQFGDDVGDCIVDADITEGGTR